MASLNPKTSSLGRRLAAHLLRRTTYGPQKPRIDAFAALTPAEAVAELLNAPPTPQVAEPIDYRTGNPWINSGSPTDTNDGTLKRYVAGWWMNEAFRDTTINHKMMFFLHTDFTASFEEDGDSAEFFDHLQLLRFYALGNWKVFARKMTLDHLMLKFLDNRYNNKWNPNENYAREFLELFTIGKGPQIAPENYTHYTEYDIQQAARVLTGFTLSDRRGANRDAETRLPMGRANFGNHDTEDKTFSSAFQGTVIRGANNAQDMFRELNDFVEMIYAQDATAKYLCRKLYRFFVRKDISAEVEQDIIDPLAATFRDNNYELRPVLEQLLTSQHFYDEDDVNPGDEVIGSLIKSPMELLLGTLGLFELRVPNPASDPYNHYDQFYMRTAQDTFFSKGAFNLFQPPSVAGYPAYHQEPGYHHNWFTANTLVARYRLPEMLLTGRRILSGGELGGGIKLEIAPFVKNSGFVSDPSDAELLVQAFLNYLLPEFPDEQRYGYFLNEIFLNGLSVINWRFEWANYESTNDDSSVRIALENLFKAIVYSPEYQLF